MFGLVLVRPSHKLSSNTGGGVTFKIREPMLPLPILVTVVKESPSCLKFGLRCGLVIFTKSCMW